MQAPDKKTLRTRLRARRRQQSAEAARAAGIAAAGFARQLPGWSDARNIALYFATDGEVDTEPLRQLCVELGKAVFLPVLAAGRQLEFARWQTDTRLRSNGIGIPEPGSGAECRAVAELDMVFLPLVGWDRRGVRLGMGGGYYDYSLAAAPEPLRVGLAFGMQEVPRLPQQDWDIRLDFVITECELHRAPERGVDDLSAGA